MIQATPTSPTATAIPDAPPTTARTLDDLAALDVARLEALYRGGHVTSLHVLDGDPASRMLAVRGLDRGVAAGAIRAFAAAPIFPWAGKSFTAMSDREGTGVNRLRLGQRWFAFETRIEASAVDGAPCIRLDYDLATNPWPIRRIRDELREVEPGLLLGPALLDRGQGVPRLLLYFACACAH